MSSPQETSVSTQDTFRLIEREEQTSSSVSALVSRLNTCAILEGSKVKEKVDGITTSAEEEGKKDDPPFPWLSKIKDLCRSAVGSKNIKTLENLLTVYLQKVTSSVNDCYQKPIRATKLRVCMNSDFVYFRSLYQDIKESVDNTMYLQKMTELMAMYLDLEIASSRRRKETTKKVSSRMATALNMFLDGSEDHILDALMRAKSIKIAEREVCCPILKKVLTSFQKRQMQDTLYVRYLLVFKLWKKIVSDTAMRKKINALAIDKLPAPANFTDRYKRFNNVLPRAPTNKNITTFYMQAKIDVTKACQNFMKISKDPTLPAMPDKPLFFEGRSQSTFSGKGNAFDGGVSRNLMNEIWSSFNEENTSNKKSNTNKKKGKNKKGDKKKEKSDSISETESTPDVPVKTPTWEETVEVRADVVMINSSQPPPPGTEPPPSVRIPPPPPPPLPQTKPQPPPALPKPLAATSAVKIAAKPIATIVAMKKEVVLREELPACMKDVAVVPKIDIKVEPDVELAPSPAESLKPLFDEPMETSTEAPVGHFEPTEEMEQVFEECEVQLGDQDLPYIEEEVVEPCNPVGFAESPEAEFGKTPGSDRFGASQAKAAAEGARRPEKTRSPAVSLRTDLHIVPLQLQHIKSERVDSPELEPVPCAELSPKVNGVVATSRPEPIESSRHSAAKQGAVTVIQTEKLVAPRESHSGSRAANALPRKSRTLSSEGHASPSKSHSSSSDALTLSNKVRTSSSEGHVSSHKVRMSTSEGPSSSPKVRTPSSEGHTSTSKTRLPSGEGHSSSPKIRTSSSEGHKVRTSSSESHTPSAKARTPSSEGHSSSPKVRTSSSEGSHSSTKIRTSSSEGRSPSSKNRTPSSEGHTSSAPKIKTASSESSSSSPKRRISTSEDSASKRVRTSSSEGHKIRTSSSDSNSPSPKIRTSSTEDNMASPKIRTFSKEVRTASPKIRTSSTEANATLPKIRNSSTEVNIASPKIRNSSTEVKTASPKIRTSSTEVSAASPKIHTSSSHRARTPSNERHTPSPKIQMLSSSVHSSSPKHEKPRPPSASAQPQSDKMPTLHAELPSPTKLERRDMSERTHQANGAKPHAEDAYYRCGSFGVELGTATQCANDMADLEVAMLPIVEQAWSETFVERVAALKQEMPPPKTHSPRADKSRSPRSRSPRTPSPRAEHGAASHAPQLRVELPPPAPFAAFASPKPPSPLKAALYSVTVSPAGVADSLFAAPRVADPEPELRYSLDAVAQNDVYYNAPPPTQNLSSCTDFDSEAYPFFNDSLFDLFNGDYLCNTPELSHTCMDPNLLELRPTAASHEPYAYQTYAVDPMELPTAPEVHNYLTSRLNELSAPPDALPMGALVDDDSQGFAPYGSAAGGGYDFVSEYLNPVVPYEPPAVAKTPDLCKPVDDVKASRKRPNAAAAAARPHLQENSAVLNCTPLGGSKPTVARAGVRSKASIVEEGKKEANCLLEPPSYHKRDRLIGDGACDNDPDSGLSELNPPGRDFGEKRRIDGGNKRPVTRSSKLPLHDSSKMVPAWKRQRKITS